MFCVCSKLLQTAPNSPAIQEILGIFQIEIFLLAFRVFKLFHFCHFCEKIIFCEICKFFKFFLGHTPLHCWMQLFMNIFLCYFASSEFLQRTRKDLFDQIQDKLSGWIFSIILYHIIFYEFSSVSVINILPWNVLPCSRCWHCTNFMLGNFKLWSGFWQLAIS